MNVVPAQLAEVGSLAVASPPQRENAGEFAGYPNPTILAACALLGVDEVYAVGGAQAVAMFAYGFADDAGGSRRAVVCDPVKLVTGPGNIYVAAAKRLLKGLIGIDAEAGPTEIAILADDSADAGHVAADLISQAEHDPLAASVLVTDSEALAEASRRRWPRRVAATKHAERVREALSGPQSGIVLVDDLDAGLAVVNAYAAEHLEIQTRDAAGVAARVRNAGAIFVGPHAPVSLGDYAAGSNHVLPTGGCACHSQRPVGAVLPARHPRRRLRRAGAARGRRATWSPWPRPRTCPAHGEAVRARFGDGPVSDARDRRSTTCCATDLRGSTPYGAPAARRAGAAQHQRELLPRARRRGRRGRRGARRRGRRGLNRYPDREFTDLREALAGIPRRRSRGAGDPEQVWAGNGSNEVLPAPRPGVRRAGPHRARLHAGLLDAPHHRDHARHPLGRRARAATAAEPST